MSLDKFFYDYLMKLIDPFLFMQLKGVRVDLGRRDSMRQEYLAKQKEAIAYVEEFAGGKKVMGKKTVSSKALAELLYDDLGLPVQLHHKTRKPTTDEKALIKLTSLVPEDKQPVFNKILEIRDYGVLISTFLDVILDEDKRLRASYNVAGTETGRLSSSGSPFWTGTNMQNWERSVRNIVTADPGYVFVYPDGEQAEARVVGRLAMDDRYNAIFESGEDVHLLMCERIFGIPYAEGKERYKLEGDAFEERDLSKRTVHGGNYGMGPRMFALIIRKPVRIAEMLFNRYHAEFPSIRSVFHAGVRQQIDRKRTLITPFGRKRQFFGRVGEDLYRQAYAHTPQATIADWLDIGLLRVWRYTHGLYEADSSTSHIARYLDLRDIREEFGEFKHPDLFPSIQIHDGLLNQVRADKLDVGIPLVRRLLTYSIQFPDGPLAIPVDLKVGTRWGTLKKPTKEWIETCIGETKLLAA